MIRDHRSLLWYINISKQIILQPKNSLKRLTYNSNRAFSTILYPFGFYNYRYNKVFLAGMALSGSTWIKNLLSHDEYQDLIK